MKASITWTDVTAQAVTANTSILTTAITPFYTRVRKFRITVQAAAAMKFGAYDGTTVKYFNAAGNLAAGGIYTFDYVVSSGKTLNFRTDTNGTLDQLTVKELQEEEG